MDNTGYITLTRQSGLLKEMQIIANNVANTSTTGFKRESTTFTEIVDRLAVEGGSISSSDARIRTTNFAQGALNITRSQLDFAIEGDGFFTIETPEGEALTRAGSFALNGAGELVTPTGNRVLAAGGAPLVFPAEAASIQVSIDGTVSADGQPIGQFELVTIEDLSQLTRREEQLFETDEPLIPAENAGLFQGFIEASNVDPILEVSRMIEVQRSYEMGQTFLENEDERVRSVIRTVGAQA